MKTNPASTKIGLAAIALVLLSCTDGWARPPRAREVCGVIQNIDSEAHTLRVFSEKQAEPLEVVWKNDTRFIHNWKFTDSGSLREDLRACVYYRTPFFGKPFVTRVVWTNGETSKPANRGAP